MLATICKRAQQSEAARGQLADAEKKGREHSKWTVKHAQDELDELRASIAEFEAASGVNINSYAGAGKIGEAVAVVLRARENAKYNLRGKIDDVEALLRGLRELDGIIDTLAAPVVLVTDDAPESGT